MEKTTLIFFLNIYKLAGDMFITCTLCNINMIFHDNVKDAPCVIKGGWKFW